MGYTTDSNGISIPDAAPTGDAGIKLVSNFTTISTAITTAQTQVNGFAASLSGDRRCLYSKSYWSDLTDFSTIGQAPTIVNGAIRFNPSNPGSFTNQAIQINGITTPDEQLDVVLLVSVLSTAGGTTYGIGIGRISINTWYPVSTYVHFNMATSPDALVIWDQTNGSAAVLAQTNSTTSTNNGDLIRLIMSERGPLLNITVQNITQQTQFSFQQVASLNTANLNFSNANTNNLRICGLGGQYDILSMQVFSRQPSNPNIVVIGDSKTMGYNALSYYLRWTSLLSSLGKVANLGGNGDRTVEAVLAVSYAVQTGARYAILNIGRNDLGSGVASATWQANYASIVSTLKAAGIIVIHLLPIPETNENQTVLTTYIDSTYFGDVRIDVSPNWVNSIHLSSDGTHPSIAGHRLIAQTIISSGAISSAGGVVQEVAPLPAASFI